MHLDFRTIDEPDPGPKWRSLFDEFWPPYKTWYLRDGNRARPSYAECRRMLVRHMPEIVGVWETLCELAGGGDIAARMLSLYRPPPYLTGCSQAIWTRGEPALLRNYDYAPRLSDGVLLRSSWTGRTVIATTDCLSGVLDGMNEDGLAVALAFGGRPTVGDGFGIPLVLRYILETCATTEEAAAVLRRTPVHMTYTVALVDQRGDAATVFVAPDRPAVVTDRAASANHQLEVEWPEYVAKTCSVDREAAIKASLQDPAMTLDALTSRFLRPPIFQKNWAGGAGTLYTVLCRPRLGVVEYHWPGRTWRLGFDAFPEMTCVIDYEPGDADVDRSIDLSEADGADGGA